MNDLSLFLFLISIVLFLIGIFSPKTSLFWTKTENKTRVNSIKIYGISTLASFVLFGITMDKQTNIKDKSAIVKKSELNPFVNIDSLKEVFASLPFSYSNYTESKDSEKNHKIVAYKLGDATNPLESDHIRFQFDPISKEIYYAALTLNLKTTEIDENDIKDIFNTAKYFDKSAEQFFRKNFKNIFYNNETSLDSNHYTITDKNLYLEISHNLLMIKKLIAKEGENSVKNLNLDVTISISNKNKPFPTLDENK